MGTNVMNTDFHPRMIFVGITLLLAACSTPGAQAITTSTAAGGELATTPTLTLPAPTEIPAIAPAVSATDTPSSPATEIPLKEALGSLEPQDVWLYFYDITQIPHPSGQMDQIRQFLVEFGQGLGLETIVDQAGNVIVRKPAAAGFENRQGVVLQAHMDMVPQKTDEKVFDFSTDPIQAYVAGEYVHADGTTLGADDGIGIALIMAVLQSKTLQVGPLEALFTVDEETTLSGANGLEVDILQGRILINLDSELEGVFIIGSAGGGPVNIIASYPQAPAPSEMVSYQVKVQGLSGGHSGADINLGRGNAIKLLVRMLKGAAESYGLRLASITGGTASNAIPTEASALIFLPNANGDSFIKYAQEFEATIQSELQAVEPDLSLQVDAVQPPAQVMDEAFQDILINALYGTPQGVIRMSDTIPDLVETSTNLGVAIVQDGQMEVNNLPRSSVNSELEDVSQMIASVWELAGYPVECPGFNPGWTPNLASPILGLMKGAYLDLFGQEAGITAVHAGTECGNIGGIYPDMDMISIGPTNENVHTTSERLYIPSVQRVMDLLSEVLQRIPNRMD
jgi:dipeptidase D